ncbi:MAG: DUF4260 domain-containing protein [Flavobacteriales bacterium]|nr:DUF4260 domain-containing protein [Flavobacteriales bacterium]
MKTLLRLEELAQFLFVLALVIFWQQLLQLPWWIYLLLLLGPDISMLGYLVSSRVGAVAYNLFHHKGLAMLFLAAGLASFVSEPFMRGGAMEQNLILVGLILYGHASMDRIFGYGLKFGDNFHHTHLGWIGKRIARDEPARSE